MQHKHYCKFALPYELFFEKITCNSILIIFVGLANATAILEESYREYPSSAVFLFFKGLVSRLKVRFVESIFCPTVVLFHLCPLNLFLISNYFPGGGEKLEYSGHGQLVFNNANFSMCVCTLALGAETK